VAEGRWITIGGQRGEDGRRHGGSPVYIEGGKITRGAPGLAGRRLDALAEPAQAEGHRTELKRERGYERATWRKKARAQGIDPDSLEQLAGEMRWHDREFVGLKTRMLKDARRQLAHFGADWRTLQMGRRGSDSAAVRALDLVARTSMNTYPELFGGMDEQDAAEHLLELLTAGNPEPMTEGEAFQQALDHLAELSRDEEPVPFRRGRENLFHTEITMPASGPGFAGGATTATPAYTPEMHHEYMRHVYSHPYAKLHHTFMLKRHARAEAEAALAADPVEDQLKEEPATYRRRGDDLAKYAAESGIDQPDYAARISRMLPAATAAEVSAAVARVKRQYGTSPPPHRNLDELCRVFWPDKNPSELEKKLGHSTYVWLLRLMLRSVNSAEPWESLAAGEFQPYGPTLVVKKSIEPQIHRDGVQAVLKQMENQLAKNQAILATLQERARYRRDPERMRDLEATGHSVSDYVGPDLDALVISYATKAGLLGDPQAYQKALAAVCGMR
jgi:hypothetical protein